MEREGKTNLCSVNYTGCVIFGLSQESKIFNMVSKPPTKIMKF